MRINFLYRALVNLFMLLMLSLVLTACNSGAGNNGNASTNNTAISATPATRAAITKASSNNLLGANQEPGALTPLNPESITTPYNLSDINIDHSGKYVYVLNKNNDSISSYSIDFSTGILTALGSTVATGNNPASLIFSSSGAVAYVINQGDNTISMYSVDTSTGTLTLLGSITAQNAIALALDPRGQYAYALNQDSQSPSILYYSIDATGKLNYNNAGGGNIATGKNPTAIAIDQSGHYVYVTNSSNNIVSMYSINSDGTLATIGTVSTGSTPLGIAIATSGKYVYVSNYTANSISMYNLDSTTGNLSAVGDPVATGTNPSKITFDPTGKYAYVICSGSIYTYTINQNTGALLPLSSPPISVANNLTAIEVDPLERYVYTITDKSIFMYNIIHSLPRGSWQRSCDLNSSSYIGATFDSNCVTTAAPWSRHATVIVTPNNGDLGCDNQNGYLICNENYPK